MDKPATVNPKRLVDAQGNEMANSWECVVKDLQLLMVTAMKNIDRMLCESGKKEGSKLTDIQRMRIIRDKDIWKGQRNAYSDIFTTTGKLKKQYGLK